MSAPAAFDFTRLIAATERAIRAWAPAVPLVLEAERQAVRDEARALMLLVRDAARRAEKRAPLVLLASIAAEKTARRLAASLRRYPDGIAGMTEVISELDAAADALSLEHVMLTAILGDVAPAEQASDLT